MNFDVIKEATDFVVLDDEVYFVPSVGIYFCVHRPGLRFAAHDLECVFRVLPSAKIPLYGSGGIGTEDDDEPFVASVLFCFETEVDFFVSFQIHALSGGNPVCPTLGLGDEIGAEIPVSAIWCPSVGLDCFAIDVEVDVAEFGLGFPGHERNTAAESGFGSRELGGDFNRLVRSVLGKHLLNPVGWGSVGLVIIENDGVGVPLLVADVAEKRCIGRHLNNVGVAFHSGDEGSFGEGSIEIAESAVAGDGVFTDIDFWPITVVVVVSVDVGPEERWIVVVVFVDDFDGVTGGKAAPEAGDGGDFGVFIFDRFGEELVSFIVSGAAVFVSDLDVFELEWLGVSVFGAECTVGGCDVTGGVFDCVEGILNVL